MFFNIYDVDKNVAIKVFGRNTVIKFLRDHNCKFDDKKINLIGGDRAIVFQSKDNHPYIVEEDD